MQFQIYHTHHHNIASHQPINLIWIDWKKSSPNSTNNYSISSKTAAVDPYCQSEMNYNKKWYIFSIIVLKVYNVVTYTHKTYEFQWFISYAINTGFNKLEQCMLTNVNKNVSVMGAICVRLDEWISYVMCYVALCCVTWYMQSDWIQLWFSFSTVMKLKGFWLSNEISFKIAFYYLFECNVHNANQ